MSAVELVPAPLPSKYIHTKYRCFLSYTAASKYSLISICIRDINISFQWISASIVIVYSHANKQVVLMDIMIGPGNFFQFFCVFCETKNAKLDPAASVASNMANFGCHHRELHWTCSYVASCKGLIGWRFAYWSKLFVTFLHKTSAICVRKLRAG